MAEGLELARQLGYENDETGLLGVQARIAALHGDEDGVPRGRARRRCAAASRNGIGWATKNARLALAELELGLGNPREAIAHFDQIDADAGPADRRDGRRPTSSTRRVRAGRARARGGRAGALRRAGRR